MLRKPSMTSEWWWVSPVWLILEGHSHNQPLIRRDPKVFLGRKCTKKHSPVNSAEQPTSNGWLELKNADAPRSAALTQICCASISFRYPKRCTDVSAGRMDEWNASAGSTLLVDLFWESDQQPSSVPNEKGFWLSCKTGGPKKGRPN